MQIYDIHKKRYIISNKSAKNLSLRFNMKTTAVIKHVEPNFNTIRYTIFWDAACARVNFVSAITRISVVSTINSGRWNFLSVG